MNATDNTLDGKNGIFATRLKDLRNDKNRISPLKRNIQQEELAAALPCSRQVIGKYENGNHLPDLCNFKKIADFFNASYDYLLGRSASPEREHVEISAETGLSKMAIETLKDAARNKANSITLTINALLENKLVLGAISEYLYHSIDKDQPFGGGFTDIVPYVHRYRYADIAANDYDEERQPIDTHSNLSAIDNDTYKRLLLLEIQDRLHNLMESESKKNHFPECPEEESSEDEYQED